MAKSIRCRLGWHSWVTQSSSDGTTRFLKCRRCLKESDFNPRQWWVEE